MLCSVPSRVRNLRKMQNFWIHLTDFEPKINIIICKSENFNKKLENFNATICSVACILEKQI